MVGKLAVVTGPSGVGKATVLRGVREMGLDFYVPVSATTRAQRQGEVDGREYFFFTPEQFQERVDAGAFVEHFPYAGNHYGTLRSELERAMADGKLVVLEIEVQGALRVRELYPDAQLIFIAAAIDEIQQRLRNRGTEDELDIERRLIAARWELDQINRFDHVVYNLDLDVAAKQLYELLSRLGTLARA